MINLLFAQYGTVSDIEIVWCFIALFGLFFSVFNVREAYEDRKILRMTGVKNGRKMIADYAFRAEISRSIIQVIFLTIGILAGTYADPPDALLDDRPLNITLLGIFFRWGLITAAVLIALKSYWSWRLRATLREGFTKEIADTGAIVGAIMKEDADEIQKEKSDQ